jgi:hypothetical protein
MRLPPYRYPGYYSLPRMLLERFLVDKAATAVGRLISGAQGPSPHIRVVAPAKR